MSLLSYFCLEALSSPHLPSSPIKSSSPALTPASPQILKWSFGFPACQEPAGIIELSRCPELASGHLSSKLQRKQRGHRDRGGGASVNRQSPSSSDMQPCLSACPYQFSHPTTSSVLSALRQLCSKTFFCHY